LICKFIFNFLYKFTFFEKGLVEPPLPPSVGGDGMALDPGDWLNDASFAVAIPAVSISIATIDCRFRARPPVAEPFADAWLMDGLLSVLVGPLASALTLAGSTVMNEPRRPFFEPFGLFPLAIGLGDVPVSTEPSRGPGDGVGDSGGGGRLSIECSPTRVRSRLPSPELALESASACALGERASICCRIGVENRPSFLWVSAESAICLRNGVGARLGRSILSLTLMGSSAAFRAPLAKPLAKPLVGADMSVSRRCLSSCSTNLSTFSHRSRPPWWPWPAAAAKSSRAASRSRSTPCASERSPCGVCVLGRMRNVVGTKVKF